MEGNGLHCPHDTVGEVVMATYEYECVGCHDTKNVVASIFDAVPEQTCEACGSKMYKVFTSPGVTFNAKGFYSTGG